MLPLVFVNLGMCAYLVLDVPHRGIFVVIIFLVIYNVALMGSVELFVD
jgi:hypothetical protein